MMGLSLDTWISVLQFMLGGAFASLVWLFRLEGRVNVLRSRVDGQEKRIDGIEDRILNHLERIESRLDDLIKWAGK